MAESLNGTGGCGDRGTSGSPVSQRLLLPRVRDLCEAKQDNSADTRHHTQDSYTVKGDRQRRNRIKAPKKHECPLKKSKISENMLQNGGKKGGPFQTNKNQRICHQQKALTSGRKWFLGGSRGFRSR